jgi:hypothetical protein
MLLRFVARTITSRRELRKNYASNSSRCGASRNNSARGISRSHGTNSGPFGSHTPDFTQSRERVSTRETRNHSRNSAHSGRLLQQFRRILDELTDCTRPFANQKRDAQETGATRLYQTAQGLCRLAGCRKTPPRKIWGRARLQSGPQVLQKPNRASAPEVCFRQVK